MNAAALLLCVLPPPAPGVPGADLPDVRASDVFHFPPGEVLRQRVRFAERHLAWLDARAAVLGLDWKAREWDYREELVRRRDLWKLALEAAVNDNPDARRCRLRDLRRGLGVADYNRGELPELPDPAWFRRAD